MLEHVVALKNLTSARKLKLKYFGSQVSLTPAQSVSFRSLIWKKILSYILLKKRSLPEV